MIDSKLKQMTESVARQCLEEIYSDLVACGPTHVEDAVESTIWQMAANAPNKFNELERTVQIIADDSNHPDRIEFLSIVQGAIKGYF